MCISAATAALIAAGTTAAGTLYSASEQADARDEQQRILAQGEQEAQDIAADGEKITNKFAQDVFDPSKRDERYEAEIGQREQSLAGALTEAASAATDTSAVGNVGGDYTKANTASRAATAASGAESARMMARLGGGSLMFGNEALMGGELASDLAGIGSRQRRNQRYTQNGVNGVNTGGSLGSALLSGVGAGASMYGGGGGFGVTNNTGGSLPTRGGM